MVVLNLFNLRMMEATVFLGTLGTLGTFLGTFNAADMLQGLRTGGRRWRLRTGDRRWRLRTEGGRWRLRTGGCRWCLRCIRRP